MLGFGEMGIDFRGGTYRLRAGDMIVVPNSPEHRPFAESECQI
jgi:mannose-6-phosphate isomerase-like protein (cupin superfamily)